MGLFGKKYAPPAVDGLSVDTLFARARGAEDPRDAHAYLAQAEVLAPNDLRIQKELLLRGDLHLRDPKRINFFVIKCYILHAFEHPEKHAEDEQKRMIREVFDHPRLKRCLELADAPEAFLQEYLDALCTEYMQLFIAGDSSHTRNILGINLGNRLPSLLAVPTADVLRNIYACRLLSPDEQRLLGRAFYRAFSAHVNGQTQPLDALLGDLVGQLIQ